MYAWSNAGSPLIATSGASPPPPPPVGYLRGHGTNIANASDLEVNDNGSETVHREEAASIVFHWAADIGFHLGVLVDDLPISAVQINHVGVLSVFCSASFVCVCRRTSQHQVQ